MRALIQRHGLFAILMGGGAALGVLRAFIVAALLDPESFGIYATVVALSIFLSPLLGFGQIEATRKDFPRLFVSGRQVEVVARIDSLIKALTLRTAILAILSATVVALWRRDVEDTLATFVIFGLLHGTALVTLLASALRATPDVTILGATQLARALVAIVAVSVATLQFGRNGALFAEAIAALAGAIIMRLCLRRAVGAHGQSLTSASSAESEWSVGNVTEASASGLLIFLAMLASSVPLYLSRPFVGANFPLSELGTLSFLLIFVTVFQTILGISDQMVGPAFVRMQHERRTANQQISILTRFVFAIVAVIALTMAIFYVMLGNWPIDMFVRKYGIDDSLWAPLTLLCVLQISSTLDWFLQAHDRERLIFYAAALYLVLTAALFLFISLHSNFSLAAFLWALAGAKFAHVAAQVVAVFAVRRRA